MNLRFFQRSRDVPLAADRAELIARYKRLRKAGREINDKLVERIPDDVFNEAGKKLGMLQGKSLVLNSEHESAVLMDYCIYDVLRNGSNAFDRYLIETPPAPESDEMSCLRAAQHAAYSVHVVESVEPGLGVTLRDLQSNEVALVVDLGFASTAQPGLVLTCRLISHDGFSMSTGSALPIAVASEEELAAVKKLLLPLIVTKTDGRRDPAPLIRECLRRGCSSRIYTQDCSQTEAGRRPVREPRESEPVGRNSSCPCGSGKKFKHCCMRR